MTVQQQIVRAARQVGQPIFYSTAIIVVAFIPLFTMTGVPGKIFAPMSITYGFALVGALLMAFTLAPVLCSFLLKGPISEEDTAIVRGVRASLQRVLLEWALDHRTVVVGACVGLLVLTFVALQSIGGEFMPALGRGESLGSRHDARGYFLRPGGAIDERDSSVVPRIARSHDDCVTAWSPGRRHRSDEFFQCRVPGQSQAGKGMAFTD